MAMADITVMELWLDRRKLDALEKSLQEQGSSTEEQMQKFFLDLYKEYVPLSVRDRIDEQFQQEAGMTENSVKMTAYRVFRNGRQNSFRTDIGSDILITSLRLKQYLSGPSNTDFEDLLLNRALISEEEFDRLAALRLNGSPNVVGVFDLDFDRCELSCVDPESGWKTFPMVSVLSAAGRTERKQGLSHEQMRALLLKNMEAWEILSPGHLSMGAFSFKDQIEKISDRLIFTLDTDTDLGTMDSLFGVDTCTSENNDFLTVSSGYDTSSGMVCRKLEAILTYESGYTRKLSYPLNDVERESLRRKMEDYCQQQTGMGLAAYSSCLRREQAGLPLQQIKPITGIDVMQLYAEMCISDMAYEYLENQCRSDPSKKADPAEEAGQEPEPNGHSMGPVMG